MSPSYTDWPKRDDKRDQPWQDPDASGITPRAGLPLLSSGGEHPDVHTIFAALAQLGYETPVSRGENPFGTLGPEEMAAVRQFRRDYNVAEDPTPWGDNDYGRGLADAHLGPWTGEAILRAAEHLHQDDDPVAELTNRVQRLERAASSASKTSSKTSSTKASSTSSSRRKTTA